MTELDIRQRVLAANEAAAAAVRSRSRAAGTPGLNPAGRRFVTSTRSGEEVAAWLELLHRLLAARRTAGP